MLGKGIKINSRKFGMGQWLYIASVVNIIPNWFV